MKATTTKEIKIVVEKHKSHDNTDMLSKRKTRAPKQKNLSTASILKNSNSE